MLIIIDKKIPVPAKERLAAYGKLLELETTGITYESISGHPDIFFCKLKNIIITAPNTPGNFKKIVRDLKIPAANGFKSVNETYPQSASYNAVVTGKYLIHRLDITDDSIIKDCADLNKINISQGYTRCSLIEFNNNLITSDAGIFKVLNEYKLNLLYVNPDDINLPGFPHGFFGGCCGVFEKKFFIIGSLKYFKDGNKVRDFINNAGFKIIELYDGPLFDGGSILFID